MVAPRAPSQPRVAGVLGVAFLLGVLMTLASFQEVRGLWTPQSARELEQQATDKVIWSMAQNQLPPGAHEAAETLKREMVEMVLRRRSVLQALAVSHALVGLLLAVSSAAAMRLSRSGRSWLLQGAGAAIVLALAQLAILELLALERSGVMSRFLPLINPAVTGLRWFMLVPPLVVSGIKIAFLTYLLAVLRRPAVRAMYQAR
jgi:hypothetical protein